MITRTHAYTLRRLIELAAKSLTDTDALDGVELFPHWAIGVEYKNGDRVYYEGTLYKCIGAVPHTSQSTWTPPDSPSLWVRVDNPAEEWPEWVQPLGSTDAYPFGAKVSHNDKHWISNFDGANIWEPGVYGWDEVE